MKHTVLSSQRQEVEELLAGTSNQPSGRLIHTLLALLGEKDAPPFSMGAPALSAELIWLLLGWSVELQPWQRDRLVAYICIATLLGYVEPESNVGVSVTVLLASCGIKYHEQRRFNAEESYLLLRRLNCEDDEIILACRLILGGEYDFVTSKKPGSPRPTCSLLNWVALSRNPFTELIRCAGGIIW